MQADTMTPERLQAIIAELRLIRWGDRDPANRYPVLMREVRQFATPEQQQELRAARLGPEAKEEPEGQILGAWPLSELLEKARAHCHCPACERWERVQEMAWEAMLAYPAMRAAEAVDRALSLLEEVAARRKQERER